MKTELAIELIRERLSEKPINTRWMNEYDNNAFFGRSHSISLLPHACGYHRQNVYNYGVLCNTIRINHFKREDCIFLDKRYIAKSIYLVVGASEYEDNEKRIAEVNKHVGQVFVAFDRYAACNDCENEEVECSDCGKDISLEKLAETNPDFVKNLVFNLQ